MFELLFKYPPSQFRQGFIELSAPWGWFALAVLVIAVAVPLLAGYRNLAAVGQGVAGSQGLLMALRIALLVVIAFCLFAPRLVVELPAAAVNRVAVLLDDSLSMRIEDQPGETRAGALERLFGPGSGSVSETLGARFDVEQYRFSEGIDRLPPGQLPDFNAAGSNIAAALDETLTLLGGSGGLAIVLVTDGGDDGVEPVQDVIDRLRVAGVKVHTVGVGSEARRPDLEIADVRGPRLLRAGDAFEAVVTIRHAGFGGKDVRLLLEENSLVVAEQTVTLPNDGDTIHTTIAHRFETPGPHDLVFRIPLEPDEALIENNRRRLDLEVHDEVIDVLHVEGEPRFEVKFIRRAIAEDHNLRLVSLVNTSDNKLFRIGVDDPEELREGFPVSAAELFEFEVVIIGSLDAARLDDAQQRNLVEFAARRGGGVLFLGGRNALAEGGYRDTPLAGLLPVRLPAAPADRSGRVRVEPTFEAIRHPVLRDFEEALWQRLPPLTVSNHVVAAKPGAAQLLRGLDANGGEVPVLAEQRYGRGTVATFAVRDSWRWQINAEIPPDDQTHERLWRQLLRWLPLHADGRLVLETPATGVPGRAVTILARAFDPAYLPMNGATVRLTIDSPAGERVETDMQWLPAGDGVYRLRYTPQIPGSYQLRAALTESGEVVSEQSVRLHVDALGDEFVDSALNADLLQRIARDTGGSYRTANDAGDLADAIASTPSETMELKRLPLWDAPALYLALLLLAIADWSLRRRWGMR